MERSYEQFTGQESEIEKKDPITEIKDKENKLFSKFRFGGVPRPVRDLIFGLGLLTNFATAEAFTFFRHQESQQQTTQEQVDPAEEQENMSEEEIQMHQEYAQEVGDQFDAAIDSINAGNISFFRQSYTVIFMEDKGAGKFIWEHQQRPLWEDGLKPTKLKSLSDGKKIQFWVDWEGIIQNDLQLKGSFTTIEGSGIIDLDKFVEIMNKRHPDNTKNSKPGESAETEDRINLEKTIDNIITHIQEYKEMSNKIEKEYARTRIIADVEEVKVEYGSQIFNEKFLQEYQEIVNVK
ncbi:MAG: hypothetical protein PHE59_01590 [Patescibacteria group bacterium]|nr:hypothetical protein [Patescibacteria group bacterium]MDD5164499.1 hypothetical protein [Patescibacteria group bacterium]MDD5534149.1 hypothetical protein [Patescibacteria group bacterium]